MREGDWEGWALAVRWANLSWWVMTCRHQQKILAQGIEKHIAAILIKVNRSVR
jgi:hypothetical protein